jgi:type VI secretion system protein ImpB
MPESTQHKLDRVRPPRVQITYDVETLGSIVKTELPFVVGIMADLQGNGLTNPVRAPDALPPLKDRKYVEIDRDNFDTIMEKIQPQVRLTSGFSDVLTFTKLEDFNPINVLRQVDDLKKNFESRTRLSNLVAKLDGNLKLQKSFLAALDDPNKQALEAYIKVMDGQTADTTASDSQTTNATAADAQTTGTTASDAAATDTTAADADKTDKKPKTGGGK